MENPVHTGLNLQEQIEEVAAYSMASESGLALKADGIEELAGFSVLTRKLS